MLRAASRLAPAICSQAQSCSRHTSRPAVRFLAVKVGETRYTKEHEYIKLTSASAGICGISEHAQQELGDVVYVDLPDAGQSFSRGDPFGSVESVKAASSVYAPVDLTVKEVNSQLKDDSGLINKGAEAEGWMLKVDLKDPKQLDALLDPAAYKKHCEEKAH